MKLDRAAVFLLVLGLLQMTGDLTGVAALKGIGAATGASPAPKVFSAVRGLETYSSRFYVECRHFQSGEVVFQQEITPAIYARLQGPYNRRNVYGAVLAYGPVLVSDPRTKPMYDSVASYAFSHGRILEELDIHLPRVCSGMHLRVVPRQGSDTADLPLVLEPKWK